MKGWQRTSSSWWADYGDDYYWGKGWSGGAKGWGEAPIHPATLSKGWGVLSDHAKGGEGKDKGSAAKGDKGKSSGVLPGSSSSNPKGKGQSKISDKKKGQGDKSDKKEGEDPEKKSRQDMSPEEKQQANLKNTKRVKLCVTATNEARSSADKGWVEPKLTDGRFNFPFAHRLRKKSPRDLKKSCRGLLIVWKNLMKEARENRTLQDMHWTLSAWAPTSDILDKLRKEVCDEILTPLGMEVFHKVCSVNTREGQANVLSHEVWSGGPKIRDLIGDALPEMPPLTGPDDTQHVIYDLHFTNYDPRFWPKLLKPREDDWLGLLRLTGQGSSRSSGVLPGSAAGHPYLGHESDTGSFWLQWHGSHVYGVMSAVAGNFLARSEQYKIDEDGTDPETLCGKALKEWQAKQDQRNKEQFETDGGGRGVYTSQSFCKARDFAVPLVIGEGKYLAKFVLLVAIPGDLSDDGVGVNFNAQRSGALWQTHELKLPPWVCIPRNVVAESLAENFPAEKRTEIMQDLHRFCGKRSYNIEDDCKSIINQMKDSQFRPYEFLQKRKSRHKMVQESQGGTLSEKPWTIMNLDGLECMSSAVHVVGFVVGYTGYVGRGLTGSRSSHVVEKFDPQLMPSMARLASGDQPVQPTSKTPTLGPMASSDQPVQPRSFKGP